MFFVECFLKPLVKIGVILFTNVSGLIVEPELLINIGLSLEGWLLKEQLP
jgi:hypothetical protein